MYMLRKPLVPPIRYERSTIMELLLQIGGTLGHGNEQFNEPVVL